MDKINTIASQFSIEGKFIEAVPYGVGHINKTYMMIYQSGKLKKRYLLQKINNGIFNDVGLMMDNIERVLAKLDSIGYGFQLIRTKSGKAYYENGEGEYYRVYSMVEQAISYEVVQSRTHAYECGKMAAIFQEVLTDFTFRKEYIEMTSHFHNTRMRFEQFVEAVSADPLGRAITAKEEVAFYMQRRYQMECLLKQAEAGRIPYRATHNDLRVSNFMMDKATGHAAALVDLDTVMPGAAAYDYGDAIRSAAKKVVFKDGSLMSVSFNVETANAFTEGYVTIAKTFLSENELASLKDGILVMSLECGIRYLTDYLQGDIYFVNNKNGENLINARREMLLVREVEKHMDEIKILGKEHQ